MIEKYRDLAAAERTFLAWIRTAVSIVGFGIVAQHLSSASGSLLITGASLALVGIGVLLIVFAGVHFYLSRKHILSGSSKKAFGRGGAIVSVLMMTVLGALLVAFVVRLLMPHW